VSDQLGKSHVVLTFQPRDGVLGTADGIFAEP
jgi:hypothetical protein